MYILCCLWALDWYRSQLLSHYSVLHVHNITLIFFAFYFADLSYSFSQSGGDFPGCFAYPINILLQSFISVCRVDLSTSMSACVACSTKCGLHETINTEPQRPFTGLVYEAQAAPNTSLNKKAVQPWQYKILYQSYTFVVVVFHFSQWYNLGFISAQALCVMPVLSWWNCLRLKMCLSFVQALITIVYLWHMSTQLFNQNHSSIASLTCLD